MIAVVDASVAYALLAGKSWDATVRQAEDLLAPDLIVPELLNARWKVTRAGHVSPTLEAALELLARLRIVPSFPYARAAAALADTLQHPVYDCLYAVVAHREGAQLLTADRRFARKLQGTALADVLG